MQEPDKTEYGALAAQERIDRAAERLAVLFRARELRPQGMRIGEETVLALVTAALLAQEGAQPRLDELTQGIERVTLGQEGGAALEQALPAAQEQVRGLLRDCQEGRTERLQELIAEAGPRMAALCGEGEGMTPERHLWTKPVRLLHEMMEKRPALGAKLDAAGREKLRRIAADDLAFELALDSEAAREYTRRETATKPVRRAPPPPAVRGEPLRRMAQEQLRAMEEADKPRLFRRRDERFQAVLEETRRFAELASRLSDRPVRPQLEIVREGMQTLRDNAERYLNGCTRQSDHTRAVAAMVDAFDQQLAPLNNALQRGRAAPAAQTAPQEAPEDDRALEGVLSTVIARRFLTTARESDPGDLLHSGKEWAYLLSEGGIAAQAELIRATPAFASMLRHLEKGVGEQGTAAHGIDRQYVFAHLEEPGFAEMLCRVYTMETSRQTGRAERTGAELPAAELKPRPEPQQERQQAAR